MTKNTTGGKKNKGKKNSGQRTNNTELPIAEGAEEKYALVVGLNGNNMVTAMFNDKSETRAKIPGKFRGVQNRITFNDIVLLGVHSDFRAIPEILYKYDPHEVSRLRTEPGVKISNLINRQLGDSNPKSTTTAMNDLVEFSAVDAVVMTPEQGGETKTFDAMEDFSEI